MTTFLQTAPSLASGDCLSRDEFLRRWEAMPDTKFAELIGGVVFMPSPVGQDHGTTDFRIGTLLGTYEVETDGVDGGTNCTWLMLQDAPHADIFLRINEDCGGHSRIQGNFFHGAPELVVEVIGSSASFDLHQKLALYELGGVDEYFVILIWEREVRWFERESGRLEAHEIPTDGIIRSKKFPGLWLDTTAILDGEKRKAMTVLKQGLVSAEHAEFVKALAARRTSK